MVPLDTVSGTELVVVDDLDTLEKLLAVTSEDKHDSVRKMVAEQKGTVRNLPDMVLGSRVRLLCLTRSGWYIGGWGLELEGHPGLVFALSAFATAEKSQP